MGLFWHHREVEEESPCSYSRTLPLPFKKLTQFVLNFVTLPACPSFQYLPCPTLSSLYVKYLPFFSVSYMRNKNKLAEPKLTWIWKYVLMHLMVSYMGGHALEPAAVNRYCKLLPSFPCDSPSQVNKQLVMSACTCVGAYISACICLFHSFKETLDQE